MQSDEGEQYRYRALSLRSSAWQSWGLGVLFFSAAVQCLTWFVFSSVPYLSGDYFHLSRPEITLNSLLMWSPIANCVMSASVLPRLVHHPFRLMRILRLGTFLTLFGAALRLVPGLLDYYSPGFRRRESLVVVLLHAAHASTAAAGACFLGFPCVLQHLEHAPFLQVHWAATLVHFGSPLGLSLGFLLGPTIVNDEDDIPRLLTINVGLAAFCALFGGLFLPPLGLQAQPSVNPDSDGPEDFAIAEFSTRLTPADRVTVTFLAGANAVLAGANTGWLAILPFFLTCAPKNPADPCFSPLEIGAVGSSHVCCGLVGCLILTRLPPALLNRRLKRALLLLLAPVFGLYVGVTLSLRTEVVPDALQKNYAVLLCALAVAGLFLQPTAPLAVELMAEVVYPSQHPDKAVCCLSNLVTLLTLLLFPFVPDNWMNATMAISTGISFIAVVLVREEYRRSDALPSDFA